MPLQPYGRIALVTFSAESADSAMSALATQHFAEQVLTSQSGIELLELDPPDSLATLLAEGDAATVAKIVGNENDVPAVFVGRLTVSNVKPSGAMSGAGLSVKAGVRAELSVRLLSARTGGTVWRSSATTNGTLGRMDVVAGMPSVAVRDPERTYGELIRVLAGRVTHDFRPTYVKQ